jgi:hypothetical protein
MKTKEEIEKRIEILKTELAGVTSRIEIGDVSKDKNFYDGEHTYDEIRIALQEIIPSLEWVLSEE